MKKLLLLLLIAVVGAGIAFGANAVFFSPTSAERPAMEPRGLVDEIAADDTTDEPTPEPSGSPSPTPKADDAGEAATSGGGGSASGGAPVSDDGDGPRSPRTPSGGQADPQATSFVVQGVVDEQDSPDDPCDLEESERDQRQCENERDREEEEQDEKDEKDDDSHGND